MLFVRFLTLSAALAMGAFAQDKPSIKVRTSPPPPKVETSSNNLPAQKIGPNDLISVTVEDAAEFTKSYRVSAEGTIRLPMVKSPVKVDGLMPFEVESAIAAELKSAQLLVDPIVAVIVSEYRSHPVSVAGAVESPVTFQASMPVSLLQAISAAGGLTEEAGPEILVSRTKPAPGSAPGETKGEVSIQRIPVKGLIDAADPELNVMLYGGEIVRVPPLGKVYVLGMVKKPGAIPMVDGSQTTVLQVLALADGLQKENDGEAFIYRRDNTGSKNDIPINLKKIIAREAPDVALLANDILYIPGDKNDGHKPTKPGARAAK